LSRSPILNNSAVRQVEFLVGGGLSQLGSSTTTKGISVGQHATRRNQTAPRVVSQQPRDQSQFVEIETGTF
jgi:hypothetical protein